LIQDEKYEHEEEREKKEEAAVVMVFGVENMMMGEED
jgi:hypothetical protein